MPVTREQKSVQLKELTEQMQKAESIIFAQYIGLKVSEVGELRQRLKSGNAEMKVAKKTLMRIAAKEAKLPAIDEHALTGPIACIYSFADPLSGAQIAFTFGKVHKQVQLIGGIFEGKLLSKEEAMALATMPSRLQLLAMFAGMVRSPLTSFASMCSSPLTGFARALAEVAKKKESPANA